MANLFKKKQEQGSSEAAVSSIPVPPADSALVIDLPEGQKLVLGKMEEGTVIEVATWRGTGRPDSRTNRLMLGVSFGGTTTPEPTDNKSEPSELSGIAKYQQIFRIQVTRFLEILRSRLFVIKETLGNRRRESDEEETLEISDFATSNSKPAKKKTPNLDDEFDIDSWLKSVRSNSRVQRMSEQESKSGRSHVRPKQLPSPKAGSAASRSRPAGGSAKGGKRRTGKQK